MSFRDKIDNYTDTIFAIVGLMNFYRYDDESKTFKSNVKLLQGKKLNPSDTTKSYQTPDIGICVTEIIEAIKKSEDGKETKENVTVGRGIVGEVKNNLPKDQTLWQKTFDQLKRYDDDLSGWPTSDKKLLQHDIVLLVHNDISRPVVNYLKDNSVNNTFTRPFVIIEYIRSAQSNPKMTFRIEHGKLSDSSIHDLLKNGKQIPMHVFVNEYSRIKLYDGQPPLPYIIHLIWEHVVFPKAQEDEKFAKLRKNQKISVRLSIEDIIKELHENYSFHTICNQGTDNQIRVPKREWVREACAKLVSIEDAEWADQTKSTLICHFQKYPNVLDYFINKCEGEEKNGLQTELFKEEVTPEEE